MAKYYLGLNVTPTNIGWAVTDTKYNLIKKKGKLLQGVRAFPKAEKADKTRINRIRRRITNRRQQRIAWLKELFSKEIAEKDPAFFLRLSESRLHEEDRSQDPNGNPLGHARLFNDADYKDEDYNKEYPTIYHLRKALIDNDEKFDIRLIYIAVQHIMKKRGHMLYEGIKLEDISFELCCEELISYLSEYENLTFEITDPNAFKNVLIDNTIKVNDKKKLLKKYVTLSKTDTQLIAAVDLLAGATVDAFKLYDIEKSDDEDVKLTLSSEDTAIAAAVTPYVDDRVQFVMLLKRLYDWSVLETLKKGERFLSSAMIKSYETHKHDLAELKALLKPFPESYKQMFGTDVNGDNNYTAYSKHMATHSCDRDKFYGFLGKILDDLAPSFDEEQKKIAASIIERKETNRYMPLQTSKLNTVIPMQLHEKELELILENASHHYAFLNEQDYTGLTKKEQILQVFRFRIPYYVGPLSKDSRFSWVERTDEKIMPWNFESVVDLAASAQNFIERMTASCSYLGENVIPKDSLLYSKYNALNIINKLRINGTPISVETKKMIFTDHICMSGGTEYKKLINFLKKSKIMKPGDIISGIDENFKAPATAYKVFREILGKSGTYDMVEDIIKHCVLFGKDSKMFEAWLHNTYDSMLTESEFRKIMKNRTRFSGWGRLSKELLTEIYHIDTETGEFMTIIDGLWDTNNNLMELLSGRYKFADAIENYRAEKYSGKHFTLEDLFASSYAGPASKRQVYQTIAIVSEIEKIMNGAPEQIFLQVARENQESKKPSSRKKTLEKIYASFKKTHPELCELLKEQTNETLQSKRVYLYFLQMGKCLYTGEDIDFDKINSPIYNVDHIYPKHYVKDDSLDNKCLVRKKENELKADHFPLVINGEIKQNIQEFWAFLRSKDLMSSEKIYRLTRTDSFSDEELASFISKTMNETNIAKKIIAEALSNRYDSTEIVVYVKGGNVDAFRNDQRLLPDGTQRMASNCEGLKNRPDPLFALERNINDICWAKEAYLNIVVGNVYHTKFTRNPLNFIKERQVYSLNRMFDYDVIRNGIVAWEAGENGTIATVRKMMKKNQILFTRYSYEKTGELFKTQPVKKGNAMVPLKTTVEWMDMDRYGGYTGINGAYFCLVECDGKKGERECRFVPVAIMNKKLYEATPEVYCTEILGLSNPKIIIKNVKTDTLFELNNSRVHLSGRSGNYLIAKNANQALFGAETIDYIRRIRKYTSRFVAGKPHPLPSKHENITKENNEKLYLEFLAKVQKAPFDIIYSSIIKTFVNGFETFKTLSLGDQAILLRNATAIFVTTAAKADLSLIGGGKSAGAIQIPNTIEKFKCKTSIIHQSVTGFYEKRIPLN